MANHLAGQTSPYLLQHVDNPVDWFPWCDEAFREALARDRPVFLSIGYSACHWCHVMARESFEDARIARLLNDHFISIKVDREERPEVDRVYMEAVQRLTGGGGWPLSVFLTPSRKPFFGGTYWPPHARAGMPGFEDVLEAVDRAWRDKRESLLDQADALTTLLRQADTSDASGEIDREPLDLAVAVLARQFDPEHGGFGTAPRFPAPLALRLLLRTQHVEQSALPAMVAVTLDRMAAGGIYDQIGGGFHRYSTDRQWRVPHFEKMLYDNALLAACYLEAWQAAGDSIHRRVVVETLDYVLREMTHPGGGFYSAQDADSGGGEGTFYLWTADEIHRLLGRGPGKRFCEFYGVTDEGNFEGRNILYRPNAVQDAGMSGEERANRERELAENRRVLLEARARREWPGRDDKILASWNGLMIDAMARAGAALDEPRYLEAAARAADFLLTELRDDRGRLRHAWCGTPSAVGAYLDDYASLTEAFITLYETRFEPRWLDEAVRLVDEILARFTDHARGDFFQTADDHEPMITRGRDMYDSPVPSGGGMATMALLRLAGLLDREDYREAARRVLRAQANALTRYPQAMCQMLLALDFHLGPTNEIAIIGGADPTDDRTILAELHRRFIPNKVIAYVKGTWLERERRPAILATKEPIGPGPTVYVCREKTCQPPLVGVDEILRAWNELAGHPTNDRPPPPNAAGANGPDID